MKNVGVSVDRWPLAVIGAGPGGLEAAATAAEHGLETLLVDAYARAGGQYFKQLPVEFTSEDPSRRQTEIASLSRRLAHPSIHFLSETVAWGIFPTDDGDWELGLNQSGELKHVVAGQVILAPGAYDRPVPFPGWTLPGVMTAGGVQSMIKSQRVLPGKRFLLSGTGPLQLAVAAALVRAGGEVVAVLEGAQVGWSLLRGAAAAWGQWERLAEGMDYARVLRSRHVFRSEVVGRSSLPRGKTRSRQPSSPGSTAIGSRFRVPRCASRSIRSLRGTGSCRQPS